MRYCITLILLGISIFCTAQLDKKAEKINVNGVILYRFLPDPKFDGYYCSNIPEIILNTTKFDFIPHNDANYTIIRQNPAFEKKLDKSELYLTGNIETNLFVYSPLENNFRDKKYRDSIINVFRQNNIYDTLLYMPQLAENMALTISSNSIYRSKDSNTVFIALGFSGSVIKYQNVIYGEQSDYRILTSNDETEEFDETHGKCPFEKYDTTFIVLNKVEKLEKVNKRQMKSIDLIESALTELKIFLHE